MTGWTVTVVRKGDSLISWETPYKKLSDWRSQNWFFSLSWICELSHARFNQKIKWIRQSKVADYVGAFSRANEHIIKNQFTRVIWSFHIFFSFQSIKNLVVWTDNYNNRANWLVISDYFHKETNIYISNKANFYTSEKTFKISQVKKWCKN